MDKFLENPGGFRNKETGGNDEILSDFDSNMQNTARQVPSFWLNKTFCNSN